MTKANSFLISIPTDDEGFIGRACDAPGCKRYFKVLFSDIGASQHCPYCGRKFDRDFLLTREQTDHVRNAAMEEARVYAVTELQKALKRAFRGSKSITYKSGPPPQRRSIVPHYSERNVDTELQCANCKTRFQVYGIFGYCPGCSCENLQIYDANWAIIRRELATAPDPTRQLRHAYGDLVSTFEVFCTRKAKQITSAKGNFQVLSDARKFFKQHAHIDILGNLTTNQALTLRRVFQKRHVCIHAAGEITDRYVRIIPEDAALRGTQASLTVQELEEAAAAMRIALGDLAKAIELPGK